MVISSTGINISILAFFLPLNPMPLLQRMKCRSKVKSYLDFHLFRKNDWALLVKFITPDSKFSPFDIVIFCYKHDLIKTTKKKAKNKLQAEQKDKRIPQQEKKTKSFLQMDWQLAGQKNDYSVGFTQGLVDLMSLHGHMQSWKHQDN